MTYIYICKIYKPPSDKKVLINICLFVASEKGVSTLKCVYGFIVV